MKLEDIIKQYGVPDPSIVGKLPRGGITLDFVGHAEINRILIDVDVNWELVACRIRKRQTSNQRNKRHGSRCGAYLTILGKTMLGVGSVRSDKPDLDKELIGDFLRNASPCGSASVYRCGLSLSGKNLLHLHRNLPVLSAQKTLNDSKQLAKKRTLTRTR
jgi:hypothetical protein